MKRDRLKLRAPINVPDAMARDELVRRIKALREAVALDKETYERWNRTHPDEPPISTDLEDRIISWLDGDGPKPVEVANREDGHE